MLAAILTFLFFVILVIGILHFWEDNRFLSIVLIFVGLWAAISLFSSELNYHSFWRDMGIDSQIHSGSNESSSSNSVRLIDTSTDEGNGWRYLYDAEMDCFEEDYCYSLDELCSIYQNLADKSDGCDIWVNFGDSYNVPAYKTSKPGYTYRVTYEGTTYYFN